MFVFNLTTVEDAGSIFRAASEIAQTVPDGVFTLTMTGAQLFDLLEVSAEHDPPVEAGSTVPGHPPIRKAEAAKATPDETESKRVRRSKAEKDAGIPAEEIEAFRASDMTPTEWAMRNAPKVPVSALAELGAAAEPEVDDPAEPEVDDPAEPEVDEVQAELDMASGPELSEALGPLVKMVNAAGPKQEAAKVELERIRKWLAPLGVTSVSALVEKHPGRANDFMAEINISKIKLGL